MDWILNLDQSLFLAINGWHNATWDGIMMWISGKTTWWPFYTLLLLFIGWKKQWRLVLFILFIALLITLADQTSVHWFKNVFQRLRPCKDPAFQDLVHTVRGNCPGGYSFVSSHAANTFGVALLVLLWMKKKWLTILMLFWGLLVAYSRVYLGVHYPADVIVGGLWGAGCGWLIYKLLSLSLSLLPQNWWVVRGRALKA